MTDRAFVTGGSGFIGRNLIPALVAQGFQVAALARSDTAAATVRALGAEPVRGDLEDEQALAAGMAGCSVVVHMAANTGEAGRYEDFYRANVEGTEHVLNATRAAGVSRLVHVSTEAVLMGGAPIVRADEQSPYPARPLGHYATTKGLAERRVLAANSPTLATMVVRPRLVWGKGDTTVLPVLIEAVKTGRLVWIGGGRHLTSTCHVLNVCEGIILALRNGKPGGIYFLTDGQPVEFRQFVTTLLGTQHVTPGNQEIPLWLARTVAGVFEGLWAMLHLAGNPPLTHTMVVQAGTEVTVDDSRARRELGYQSRFTIVEGMRAMAS